MGRSVADAALALVARDAPQIQVEVDASFDVIDLEAQGFDIGVRYAQSLPAHFKTVALFEQVYVPVCTPEIAQRIHRLEDSAAVDAARDGFIALGRLDGRSRYQPGQRCRGSSGRSGLYFSHGALTVTRR